MRLNPQKQIKVNESFKYELVLQSSYNTISSSFLNSIPFLQNIMKKKKKKKKIRQKPFNQNMQLSITFPSISTGRKWKSGLYRCLY
jgi:hypothetical protein